MLHEGPQKEIGQPASVGKPKAAKVDNRPKKPSGLGNQIAGKQQRVSSNRGRQSMGGGHQRGGAHRRDSQAKRRRRWTHRGGGGGPAALN